jgi:ABC-type glycerol-3-phosphate transport system permease component
MFYYRINTADRVMDFIDRWSRRIAWAVMALAIIFIIIPAICTLQPLYLGLCVGGFLGTFFGVFIMGLVFLTKERR